MTNRVGCIGSDLLSFAVGGRRGWFTASGIAGLSPEHRSGGPGRCLYCHARSGTGERNGEQVQLRLSQRFGVGCERCHGPSSEHIAGARNRGKVTA